MRYRPDTRAFNLVNYLDYTLLPCLRVTDERFTLVSVEYRAAEVVEALLWLDLGVRVKYFPEGESRRFVETLYAEIRGSYDVHAKRLRDLFSEYHFSRLESAIRRRSFFREKPEFTFTDDQVGPALQTAMLLIASFSGHDIGFRAFTDALAFADPPTWDRFLDGVETARAERVAAVMSGSGSGATREETFVAGALRALEYMDEISNLIETIRDCQAYEGQARTVLAGDIGAIQMWRLNVSHERVGPRFAEVWRSATAFLERTVHVRFDATQRDSLIQRYNSVVDVRVPAAGSLA